MVKKLLGCGLELCYYSEAPLSYHLERYLDRLSEPFGAKVVSSCPLLALLFQSKPSRRTCQSRRRLQSSQRLCMAYQRRGARAARKRALLLLAGCFAAPGRMNKNSDLVDLLLNVEELKVVSEAVKRIAVGKASCRRVLYNVVEHHDALLWPCGSSGKPIDIS